MIVLVFLGTSCKKHEELSFCDFDFMIGKWDVSVVKKKENLSTHTIVEIDSFTYTYNFEINNTGFFNENEADSFIWAAECEPDIILISEPLRDQNHMDTGKFFSIHYIVTDGFKPNKIEMFSFSSELSNNEVISTNYFLTLTK